jgi:dipeptidyl aminopeptidase/acylaminoacyl peptidase
LADVKPIIYQSRDGLLIPGYLTLPKGVPGKNLPAVVLPHGGPWARDAWGFNPVLQFLANRGYAVLQMNFRGSTGFGRKFWEISFKEWGRKMQDDVTDGARWLISEGIADPKRVGIYGGSYGGYVVLAGLAFTPDLYACGADYVGVANLFTILETIPPYWEPMRQMMYEMMGDPEQDEDLMRAVSPVFHAEAIKAPLLIAQGAQDPRVKKAESDQMVEALRKRGVAVPYMVKENEGHGFRNEENRFEFYRALEQFLGKYLGGRVEAGDDILGGL